MRVISSIFPKWKTKKKNCWNEDRRTKRNLHVCHLQSPNWKLELLCLKLYTWSPSMPLLTPLRRKGSPAPMLKEANYSQYLPHSGEARSRRGQACEAFLQPAADGPPSQLGSVFPCPPLSSFLLLHLRPPPAPLFSSVPLALLTFFCLLLINRSYCFSRLC